MLQTKLVIVSIFSRQQLKRTVILQFEAMIKALRTTSLTANIEVMD